MTPEPPINPPSVYADAEQIDCPACDNAIVEPVAGEPCPACGHLIDDDTIRDQIEDQRTPPEWT